MTLAIILSLVALLVVAWPLFVGSNEPLQPGSTQNSPEVLQAMQDQIVTLYRDAERQHKSGDIAAREWAARQEFLRRRYIDVTRRLDYAKKVTS
jgi:hypothetical protein